jgi:hypothetical protein
MLGLENTLEGFFGDEGSDKKQYKEGELVFPEGKSPYVYHSPEYIRRENDKFAQSLGYSNHEEFKENGYRAKDII